MMPASSRAWAASLEVVSPSVLGTKVSRARCRSYLAISRSRMRSSKVPRRKKIADDRLVLLAVAVDAAVALFQPVGIERQFQVDEMVAALVEVETLGGRIGADQDDALLGRGTAG